MVFQCGEREEYLRLFGSFADGQAGRRRRRPPRAELGRLGAASHVCGRASRPPQPSPGGRHALRTSGGIRTARGTTRPCAAARRRAGRAARSRAASGHAMSASELAHVARARHLVARLEVGPDDALQLAEQSVERDPLPIPTLVTCRSPRAPPPRAGSRPPHLHVGEVARLLAVAVDHRRSPRRGRDELRITPIGRGRVPGAGPKI